MSFSLSHSRFRSTSSLVVVGLLLACSSAEPNPEQPPEVPGIQGGELAGSLSLRVVDGEGSPVPDATVFLGDGEAAAEVGRTDADGLLEIHGEEIRGAVTLTVLRDGWVAEVWSGIAGNRVTIGLERRDPGRDTATVQGTLLGWESLPAPGEGRYRLAVIQSTRPGDPVGDTGRALRALAGSPLEHTCTQREGDDAAECRFELEVEPGRHVNHAVIYEGDDAGTPGDHSDDVLEIAGFAMAAPVELTADEHLEEHALEILGEDALFTAGVRLTDPPGGLTAVVGVPGVGLGDDGVIVYPAPFGHAPTEVRLPRPGAFGDAVSGDPAYWVVGSARSEDAISVRVRRGLQVTDGALDGSLTVEDWLAPPTDLALEGGTIAFESDGRLHRVELESPDGEPLARVWIFGGETAIELPAPVREWAGGVEMRVLALDADHDPASLELQPLVAATDRRAARESVQMP